MPTARSAVKERDFGYCPGGELQHFLEANRLRAHLYLISSVSLWFPSFILDRQDRTVSVKLDYIALSGESEAQGPDWQTPCNTNSQPVLVWPFMSTVM